MNPNHRHMYPRLLILYFLLMAATWLPAQEQTTVKAYTDKSRILIGEPLLLTVEVSIPEREAIRFVPIDSIPHFEWLEKPVIDTQSNNSGTLLKSVIRLTSFDSGQWVIPAFELSGGLKTDSIPVDVVFSDFDSRQDYHDIKDILEADPVKKQADWWWYAAGGAVLLLLVLYFVFRKKKKAVPAEKVTSLVNPYEEAMQELRRLEGLHLPAKEIHTRLSGLFRQYVFRKNGILSLQKTTDDLVLQLKSLEINKEVFDTLAQALRLGDFVKFAQFEPGAEENRKAVDAIKNAIEFIEKING